MNNIINLAHKIVMEEHILFTCSEEDYTDVHNSLIKVGEQYIVSYSAYRWKRDKLTDHSTPESIITPNFENAYKQYNQYHKMYMDMIKYFNTGNVKLRDE